MCKGRLASALCLMGVNVQHLQFHCHTLYRLMDCTLFLFFVCIRGSSRTYSAWWWRRWRQVRCIKKCENRKGGQKEEFGTFLRHWLNWNMVDPAAKNKREGQAFSITWNLGLIKPVWTGGPCPLMSPFPPSESITQLYTHNQLWENYTISSVATRLIAATDNTFYTKLHVFWKRLNRQKRQPNLLWW